VLRYDEAAFPGGSVDPDPPAAAMTVLRGRRSLYHALTALLLSAALLPARGSRRAVAGEPTAATPQVNAAAFAGLGKLVFVQNGILYALDGTSETLTVIDASGAAASPAWSPDGEWLAYLALAGPLSHEGRLSLARADGTLVQAVDDLPGPVLQFAWSPREDVLAATLGGTAQTPRGIWLVAPSVPSLELVNGRVDEAAWSPDGTQISFVSRRHFGEAGPGDQLETVASDGGAPLVRYTAPSQPDTGIENLGWTSDGTRLLFALDPYHSASLLADGANLFSLPPGGGPPLSLTTALLYADWRSFSPDGRSLALVAGSSREVYTGKAVSICDLTGGGCAPLPKPAGTVTVDPAWSPDGTRIAEVQVPDIGHVGGFGSDAERDAWLNAHALVVVQPDGTRPLQLSPPNEAAGSPRWSRDGGTILYLCGVTRGVCVVPGDGSGGPVQVVDSLSGPPPSPLGPLGYYGHFDPALVLAWWQPGG
jgi:Tol biopolymer transport system component